MHAIELICGNCSGLGRVWVDRCPICRGSGLDPQKVRQWQQSLLAPVELLPSRRGIRVIRQYEP